MAVALPAPHSAFRAPHLSGLSAVADVVADLEASDEPVPVPIATRRYSGRFLIRVPPELHRQLALDAAEAGVSLNRLASAKLGKP